MLSSTQLAQFGQDGYLLLRQRVPLAQCAQLREVVAQQLQAADAPLEYETDVGYAGAPASPDAPGGRTVRRLRGAWNRHPRLREWAAEPALVATLQQLFGQPVVLNLAHHNCVMTKHPEFGTATGWHRDIRYWSFADANLITAWLALGPEYPGNGGLQVIPGSHRWHITPQQLDDLDFLRPDLPGNQALMAQGISLTLAAGDVLLFHSGLFHAAGANLSGEQKWSVVFAYHGQDNLPVPGSRSAASGEVALEQN
ncbi:phytanoyl-CoA dioxygenase family protein [Actimicrobium antarcticum]|uniref:Phytanoyl-CoA dioxygenase family protein n=2 Tax=Actimicrobium antarcticum TaxID=1051899 RepID=A0ABP7TY41_9BURK